MFRPLLRPLLSVSYNKNINKTQIDVQICIKKLPGVTLGVSVAFLMVIKCQIILSLKCNFYAVYWMCTCIFGSQPVRVSEVENSRQEGL